MLASAAALALAAWVFLVVVAVRFGRDARAGDGGSWVFLGVASLGAVAALALCLGLARWAFRALGAVGGSTHRG